MALFRWSMLGDSRLPADERTVRLHPCKPHPDSVQIVLDDGRLPGGQLSVPDAIVDTFLLPCNLTGYVVLNSGHCIRGPKTQTAIAAISTRTTAFLTTAPPILIIHRPLGRRGHYPTNIVAAQARSFLFSFEDLGQAKRHAVGTGQFMSNLLPLVS